LSRPDDPPFAEPWQAQTLAMADLLQQAGFFTAAEWATALGAQIRRAQACGDPDDGSTYYHHVLGALEALTIEKSISTQEILTARKDAWAAAYGRTPHGRPVTLD
jgi:nitrile hydratase accessory protein